MYENSTELDAVDLCNRLSKLPSIEWSVPTIEFDDAIKEKLLYQLDEDLLEMLTPSELLLYRYADLFIYFILINWPYHAL